MTAYCTFNINYIFGSVFGYIENSTKALPENVNNDFDQIATVNKPSAERWHKIFSRFINFTETNCT